MSILNRLAVIFFVVSFCFALVIPSDAMAAYKAARNVEVSDPLESVNRAVYGFNRFFDKILFKPIAKAYNFIVPEIGRKGISNVLQNLTEPVTFVNSLLQGDVEHSAVTFWRFTLNSTFGVVGIFDIAKVGGLAHRKEDFGQTVATYGAGGGAYLMLPVFGPSNVRDAFGKVIDVFSDPFNYMLTDYATGTRAALSGVSSRADKVELLNEIDRVSLDPYAAIRSLYTQKRNDAIRNGE